MNLQFHCPYCQILIAVDSSAAGGNIQCPNCSNVFIVQAPVPVVQVRVVGPAEAPALQPPAQQRHPPPISPKRPGPARPGRPPAAKSAAASKAHAEETKAKLLIVGLLAGGVVLIFGGVSLVSYFTRKAGHDEFALPESVLRREAASREALKKEQEEQRAHDAKDRAEFRNYLVRFVAKGNEKVADALVGIFDDIENDLDARYADKIAGNEPSDLSQFWRNELAARSGKNPIVFNWLGGRAPSALADAIFGRELDESERGKLPAFLTAGTYSGMGTGFFVSKDGWLLTNSHVVGDAAQVDIRGEDGKIRIARVVRTDEKGDVALLKAGDPPRSWLSLAAVEPAMGANVFTIGYPNAALQGVEPKFTDGRVSSLTGFRDDKDSYQVSVPIQRGNSGGPLVAMSGGRVVGITSAVLGGGDNVSYAIKSRVANALIDAVPEARANVSKSESTAPMGSETAMIEQVKSATVLILVNR